MGMFRNKFKVKPFTPFARRNIGVVGLGLIGASVAKSLVQNERAINVIGVDVLQENIDLALKDHVIAFGHTDINILRGCEIIFIAVPLARTAETISKVFSVVSDTAIISDVAGVKGKIFASLPKGIRFVSGHPMAGKETSGFAVSDGDVLMNCPYILIRDINTVETDFNAVKSVINIFTDNVIETDARTHDLAVAKSSHLPHMLAYTLSSYVFTDEDAVRATAGGVKDMTRVAKTEPALWVDTCRDNKKALSEAMDDYIRELTLIKTYIDNGDLTALETYFAKARELRLALEKSDTDKGKI